MGGLLTSIVPAAVKGVDGWFKSSAERKAVRVQTKAKIELAKQNTENTIELNRSEWENLSIPGLDKSWKDEWVTIIITLPIVVQMVGTILAGFFGDERLLTASKEMVDNLNNLFNGGSLGLSFGDVAAVVIFAAIGLRVWGK